MACKPVHFPTGSLNFYNDEVQRTRGFYTLDEFKVKKLDNYYPNHQRQSYLCEISKLKSA